VPADPRADAPLPLRHSEESAAADDEESLLDEPNPTRHSEERSDEESLFVSLRDAEGFLTSFGMTVC